MKMFCLHHIPAIHRKKKLLEDFNHHNLQIEWVESFIPESIDKHVLNIRHPLNDAALSLYLKHRWCIQQQKIHKWDNMVIFEDDTILPYNMNIELYLSEVEEQFNQLNGDICFIGGAFGIVPSVIDDTRLVYCEPGFRSRCTHCYIINIQAIDKIINHIDIIDDAIDWKFNQIIKNENLRCCYVEPALYQSSVEGIESSLIQNI